MRLELRSVSHRFWRGTWLLRDIDLAVDRGETVAIVGPSGSGKTTLISILGGLLNPLSGCSYLDGQPIGVNQVPAGELAWIFQGTNLLGHRTLAENAALGALARGDSYQEAEVSGRNALATVGLAGRERQRASTVSGGEAQRVGVARALTGSPSFVLADEPTGQLDHATSIAVIEAVFASVPTHTSLVVATHDREFAARCDRTLALIDGTLEAA